MLKLGFVNLDSEPVKKGPEQLIIGGMFSVEDVEHQEARKEPISEEEVMIGSQVTLSQREELLSLLNEYRPCFAKDISELGCTSMLEMDIVTQSGAVPVYSKGPIERR